MGKLGKDKNTEAWSRKVITWPRETAFCQIPKTVFLQSMENNFNKVVISGKGMRGIGFRKDIKRCELNPVFYSLKE